MIMYIIVRGDLNLSKLDLPTKHVNRTHFFLIEILDLSETPKVIASPIRINDSIFDGFVYFNNSIFNEMTDFSGSNFTRDAYFRGATAFSNATFSTDAFFNKATFNKNADFIGTSFNNVDFNNAIFRGDAQFYGARFKSALFIKANFSEDTQFGEATFGMTWFDEATFNGNASFDGAKFENAFFPKATFNRCVIFGNAIFSQNAGFSEVTFSKNALFLGTNFSGDTRFDGARFKNAFFSRATFGGYFFGWNDIKNALTCDEVTYLKLIKNFKDHGQFDDADDCYYTYRSRYMKGPSDYLAKITCGFGVRWVQTIYFGIFWLLFFGLIYFLMIVAQCHFNKYIIIKQLLNSFWFSAMVLLSVPSELYPKKIDIYKEYTSKIKYHLPILERLIGWGVLILFINTLSREMLHL